ncbi:DUF805 domain-containing protein [Paucilactobacillus sp. N302-9]
MDQENAITQCQNCHKDIPAEATFCPYCGFKQIPAEEVSSEQTEQQPTQETTASYVPVSTPASLTSAEDDVEPAANTAPQQPAPAEVQAVKPAPSTQATVSTTQEEKSTFSGALRRYFHNLLNIKGRSSVADYWWPQLLMAPVYTVLCFILFFIVMLPTISNALSDSFYNDSSGIISTILSQIFGFVAIFIILDLLYFFFNFSVMVRRLHDSGKSGLFMLFYLLGFIPYIGALASGITMFVFSLLPSDSSANQYGKPTKTTNSAK